MNLDPDCAGDKLLVANREQFIWPGGGGGGAGHGVARLGHAFAAA